MLKKFFLFALGLVMTATGARAAGFTDIAPILAERCLDCHAAQDPEGSFVMESFETLMKGGESGPAVLPGKASESLLVRMIEGSVEKDGKKKIMPPGKRKKLTAEEIALIRTWIDEGAKAEAGAQIASKDLKIPKIEPLGSPRKQINTLAASPDGSMFALARYNVIELRSSENRALIRSMLAEGGPINALAFSPDGSRLFSAGGDSGLPGQVHEFKVSDGKLIRSYSGHRDAAYAVAVSPDGKLLATGSYDQKIKLWNTADGQEVRTLSGHNGCIYSLAFRADGRILASASGDRTVKLWDVETGERRDTLSQALKELYSVAFSPDGKYLLAAGVDNRIRQWSISEKAAETTNPLLIAKFGHEGAILKLAFSPDGKTLASSADDRTVKLWNAADLSEKRALSIQPDWPPALAFISGNNAVAVGRLDGTFEIYNAATGEIVPLPKPRLATIEPRGVQRGMDAKIHLTGKNLEGVTNVFFNDTHLHGTIESASGGEAWVSLKSDSTLARGTYELWVTNLQGESSRVKLNVDDIPQHTSASVGTNLIDLPAAVWGLHATPGDTEKYFFKARQGDKLVFDIAAKSIGSKADTVLTLSDSAGRVLASNNGFDGTADPFLAWKFAEDGVYQVTISEQLIGGSPEHFYKLTIGALPYVTAAFPLTAGTNGMTEVEYIGANLPSDHRNSVASKAPGEIDVPIDSEKFRARRAFKLLVQELPQQIESEPNDSAATATKIETPGAVAGRFWSGKNSQDADYLRFTAKRGEEWMIETMAARRGSPADTKIEVLDHDGKPVERLLLQAVRNSAITFRGIDSTTTDCRVENWEEMELNQYLYLQGEVVKLFRAPQGPDSGFLFYSSNGRRHCFFDTSASAHAVEEPCYIIEPHPPGAKLPANGLPVFPLYYANDDDGERKLGTDSKLHFTAPADGDYIIRVSDTRGFSGERYAYTLSVRRPQPDFRVSLSGANPTVGPGSGQSFTVSAERLDDFEGEIRVEISGLPTGFIASNPLVIQAGHSSASGTLFCLPGAAAPDSTNAISSKITASASIAGKTVMHEVNNFGTIKRGAAPKLYVSMEHDPAASAAATASGKMADSNEPLELTIAPGQTIPAWLRIQRNGHDDLVTFTVENLPHGIIVDNIGLNGVLIPKDQNEREIFLNAAKWVPDTDRLCYAIENQAGRQTSRPVMLHVRRNAKAP